MAAVDEIRTLVLTRLADVAQFTVENPRYKNTLSARGLNSAKQRHLRRLSDK